MIRRYILILLASLFPVLLHAGNYPIKNFFIKQKHGAEIVSVPLGKSIGIQTARDSVLYRKYEQLWILDSIAANFIRVTRVKSYDTIEVHSNRLSSYYQQGYELHSYIGRKHTAVLIRPKVFDKKIFWLRDIQKITYAERDVPDEALKMAILSPVFIVAAPVVAFGKSGFTTEGIKFGAPLLVTGVALGIFYLARKPKLKIHQYLMYDWDISIPE